MWPRTAPRVGAEVWFEMQIGDEAVPVRMPLIFVDNIAANDEHTVKALVEYYNQHIPVECRYLLADAVAVARWAAGGDGAGI